MPTIELSTGINMYYERHGSGVPLVLIMGTGLDHSGWYNQIEEYSKYFECIVFDNRGVGKTEGSDSEFSTSLMAEDILSLLEILNIKKAHFSGVSLGSCVAQEVVIKCPDIAYSLQLHGTWANAEGYAERKFKAQINLLKKLDMREFYEINVLWFLTPNFMRENPSLVETMIESAVEKNYNKKFLIAQYMADLHHNSVNRLSQISVPTLITVGSFDLATPVEYALQVKNEISESEMVVWQNGGHLHNIENPKEFNMKTLEFMLR